MNNFIQNHLALQKFQTNENAMNIIRICDNWYKNNLIEEFHNRQTVQGRKYEIHRLGFAKRCCSDDANLCEVVEINAGEDNEQFEKVLEILAKNEFNTQYRKQLEKVSAIGTVACYIRLDNANFYEDGSVKGGEIKLNYVDGSCFIPLTVENDIITEAAFYGADLVGGRTKNTIVVFKLENGLYKAITTVLDDKGLVESEIILQLGEVKPFAVMRTAEVNNLDNMVGYGIPKIYNAIPMLQVVDLCFNVFFGDLDKAEKLVLINEMLCKFDSNGVAIPPNEQMKKIFVMLGENFPNDKPLVQEINPTIRVEEITKAMELALSLLSMQFGYGTKKYSFENGQIKTATEYVGERQDQMQELNKQRQESIAYISQICKAIIWFSNKFNDTNFDENAEICVQFDDSFITDKGSELESMRADALSFPEVKEFLVQYVMIRLNCERDEAIKYIGDGIVEVGE